MFRMLTVAGLCYGLCMSQCMAASAPVEWLKKTITDEADVAISMEKQKLSFKGCRQRQYVLSVSKSVSDSWDVEAIAHYNKGSLQFGVLRQQVRTRAVEVIAWWQQQGYRIGLMHKARPQHDVALPMGDTLRLPTSQTTGLYVDMPFEGDSHQSLRLAALHETWSASGASVDVPWNRARDSQLSLQYSVAF